MSTKKIISKLPVYKERNGAKIKASGEVKTNRLLYSLSSQIKKCELKEISRPYFNIINSFFGEKYIIVNESASVTSDKVTRSLQTALETSRDYNVSTGKQLPVIITDITSNTQEVNLEITEATSIGIFVFPFKAIYNTVQKIKSFTVDKKASLDLKIIDVAPEPMIVGNDSSNPHEKPFSIQDFVVLDNADASLNIVGRNVAFIKDDNAYSIISQKTALNIRPKIDLSLEACTIYGASCDPTIENGNFTLKFNNCEVYGDYVFSNITMFSFFSRCYLAFNSMELYDKPPFFNGLDIYSCNMFKPTFETPALDITGTKVGIPFVLNMDAQSRIVLFRRGMTLDNITIDCKDFGAEGIEFIATLPATGLYKGHTVYAEDTDIVSTWNGAAWLAHY